MRRWGGLTAALGLISWLASPAVVQALPIIDSFDAPTGGQVVNLADLSDTATGLAGVEGGSRRLDLAVQNTFSGGSGSETEINTAESPGTLQVSNGPNIDTVVKITWDASAAGLDLNLSAFTGFALEGIFQDRSTSYKITIETFGGGTSTATVGETGEFAGTVSFDFGDFSGTASLSNIDRIVLEIDGARAADISLDRIVAVPEPTAALTLGLGLAGLGWMGRRRPSAGRA